MAKRYRVELSEAEREELRSLTKKSQVARRKALHARILLKADESPGAPSWGDADIAQALEVGVSTVERVRQRLVEEGLEVALAGRPSRRRYQRRLDGAGEAKLIALACSPAPEGNKRWTLQLLGQRLVELQVVESIGTTTVYETLKKMNLSLG